MIVRSIRLQNIKSYGEGADGGGITIAFEPGINRIAGRNGHGKSTLTESLGYALFFSDPVFEENFKVATYLLRTGKAAGEIDVTFTHDGEIYRLERGLGLQSRRRAKIVQLSDGSIAAEGDAEVESFLCRVAGAADRARLAELFAKLIGVKQGRLTLPFDSTPTEARKHFEPLLDVEIFRQCFERLKPVVDEFEEMRRAEETKLATIAERIRERAESPAKAAAAARQSESLGGKVKAAQERKEAAAVLVGAQEAKEKTHREAERARADFAGRRDLAKHRYDTAAQRLREAREAVEAVAKTKAAHDAYAAADAAAKVLQQKQEQRATLREQLAAQQRTLAQLEEQAAAARRRSAEFAEEARVRAGEVEKRRGQLSQDQANIARDRAAELENESAKRVETIAARLTETEQQRKTLAAQLAQIAGGVCPFLKEACRQFDAAKVQADLSEFETALPPLRRELESARADFAASQKATRSLTTKRAQLESEAKAIDALAMEIARLGERAAAEATIAEQRAATAATGKTDIARRQEAIAAFGDLDAESRRLQTAKEASADGHRTFLAEKAKADDFANREKALAEAMAALDALEKNVAAADTTLAAARQDFDADALAAARRDLQEATAAAATCLAELASVKAELDREQKRVGELAAAQQEKAALDLEIARLNASIALTEKARTILKNAAPQVAQHLCDRIAAQAQQIFNRLNHDPCELVWSAQQYSLRIQPGDRRFAMLSGGEQTKLALAMTLAMIGEFSTLRFCLFDEPTYGVDADSREKLADAIVEVQKISGFDQLLLVSHDDAFDGKIEHVVCVKKNAVTGTAVEISG